MYDLDDLLEELFPDPANHQLNEEVDEPTLPDDEDFVWDDILEDLNEGEKLP